MLWRCCLSIHNVQTSSPVKPWQNKTKFYVVPPYEGETKVLIKSPGHMTKRAAMSINVIKPLEIFFSSTSKPMILKLGL